MATGAEFVNLNTKRILGRADFADRFLEYLREDHKNFSRTVYRKDGTFDAVLGLSADGSDKFKVDGTEETIDGDGHVLGVDASGYASAIQFENTNAVVYDVALHYAEMPSGIQINPRTGYPEFEKMIETVGDRADPDLVAVAGGGLNLRVNSVTEAGVSNAGRSCAVWKKSPGQGATVEATAIEIVTVQYSGGNNYVLTTGQFGQGTPSTDPAEYFVLLLGPTVRRNVSLDGATGYSFLGTVTGTGAGNPPVTFDTSGQREITATLTSLSEVIRTDSHGFAKIRVKADASDVNEKQIEVQDSSGVPKFYVDEDGDVTIVGNLQVTGTTTQDNVVQVNSNETVTGNLTAGDTTSDSHVVKGAWKHTDNAGTANHFYVDGATGRIGIGQTQDASYSLAVTGGARLTTGNLQISTGVLDVNGTGTSYFAGDVRLENTTPRMEWADTNIGYTAGRLWRIENVSGDFVIDENTNSLGNWSTYQRWIWMDRSADQMHIAATVRPSGTRTIGTSGDRWNMGWYTGINVAASTNTTAGTIRYNGGIFEGRNGSGWIPLDTQGQDPGGADTQVQFNSSGNFGGSADLTWASSILYAKTVRLGTTADTTAGNLRWDGSNFQGYNGGGWIDLDTQGQPPGGATTNVQFNNASVFDGDSSFTWDDSGKRLTVGNFVVGAPNSFDDLLRVTRTYGATTYSSPRAIYYNFTWSSTASALSPTGLNLTNRASATSGNYGTSKAASFYMNADGSGSSHTGSVRGVHIQVDVDPGHTTPYRYGLYIDGTQTGTISTRNEAISIGTIDPKPNYASAYALRAASGGRILSSWNYTANVTAEQNQLEVNANAYGNNSATMRAAYFHGRNYENAGGSQSTIEGAYIRAGSSGNVAGSAVRALRILADPGSLGSWTSAVGIEILNSSSTSVTTKYGLLIQSQSGAADNFGAYVTGPKNYFGGNTGFGYTAAGYPVDVTGDIRLSGVLRMWDGTNTSAVMNRYGTYSAGTNLAISPGAEIVIHAGEETLLGAGLIAGGTENLHLAANSAMYFWTGTQSAVAGDLAGEINSSGLWGLNIAPQTAVLNVGGGIRAGGGVANGASTNAGYTFNGTGDNDSGMFCNTDGTLKWYLNNSYEGSMTTTAFEWHGGEIRGKDASAFRLNYNPTTSQGVILRKDESDFYFLLTADNDGNGAWNTLRPFVINLSTAATSMKAYTTQTLKVEEGTTTIYSAAYLACLSPSLPTMVQTAATNWGVIGRKFNAGGDGGGVMGWNDDNGTRAIGVHGNCSGTTGSKFGVYGECRNAGSNYAIYGYATGGTTNYGILNGGGSKSWANPHPKDPAKRIDYITIEGGENTTFIRGRAQLVNGEATVDFEEHFSLVTNAELEVTMTVTPRSAESKGLAVLESDNKRFVVKELHNGSGTYEFDFVAVGKRLGYEFHEPIQDQDFYVPNSNRDPGNAEGEAWADTQDFYDGHSEGMLRIFKMSGLLLDDGKINPQTFADNDWPIAEDLGEGAWKITDPDGTVREVSAPQPEDANN
jgi:hypothetical protein